MKTEKRLPKTPSTLIALALDDLNKVERRKGYKVDMSSWHLYIEPVCLICFAGAVMAQTLKATKTESLRPNAFSLDTNSKLVALDYFRIGTVGLAFSSLGILSAKGRPFSRHIPEYRKGRGSFKRAMRELARDLKAAGF